MAKGKKRAVTLIALCVLMAAAIGLYVFLPEGESDDDKDGAADAETIEVMKVASDQISSVRISGEGREDISLVREGDEWKLSDLPKAPLDKEAVEGMFTNLDPVKAVQRLDVTELSEYGLDDPQMIVTIGMSDGAEYELKFGQTVPAAGGMYGMCGGEKDIYTFEEALFSSFDVEKNTLIQKEELAGIDPDHLTSISVCQDGKETFLAEVVSDDKKVDAYTNWVISKPCKKPLAGSSTEDWSTMQGYFTNVTFGDLVEYGCKDLGKYGLDQPSSYVDVKYFEVKDGYEVPEETESPDSGAKAGGSQNKANTVPDEYKDAKHYRLLFGKKMADGDYYVCLDGSDQVYTLAAQNVEQMLGVDAYTYMDHCVYSTLATDITGYDVTIGKKKISVSHTTEQDEGGNQKNVWTLNGTRVPDSKEEEFLTPYSKQYLLEFTSAAKDSVKPDSKEPIMTIVFHEEKRDVTVRYLPYDGTNFYRVDKDGMDYFLVDKRSVDDVAAAFGSLLEIDLHEE